MGVEGVVEGAACAGGREGAAVAGEGVDTVEAEELGRRGWWGVWTEGLPVWMVEYENETAAWRRAKVEPRREVAEMLVMLSRLVWVSEAEKEGMETSVV